MLRVRKCVFCGVLFAVCPRTLFFHHHRFLEQVFSSLPVRARLCFHTQVSSSPTRTPHVTEIEVCRTVRLQFTIWRHLEDWTRLAFASLCRRTSVCLDIHPDSFSHLEATHLVMHTTRGAFGGAPHSIVSSCSLSKCFCHRDSSSIVLRERGRTSGLTLTFAFPWFQSPCLPSPLFDTLCRHLVRIEARCCSTKNHLTRMFSLTRVSPLRVLNLVDHDLLCLLSGNGTILHRVDQCLLPECRCKVPSDVEKHRR